MRERGAPSCSSKAGSSGGGRRRRQRGAACRPLRSHGATPVNRLCTARPVLAARRAARRAVGRPEGRALRSVPACSCIAAIGVEGSESGAIVRAARAGALAACRAAAAAVTRWRHGEDRGLGAPQPLPATCPLPSAVGRGPRGAGAPAERRRSITTRQEAAAGQTAGRSQTGDLGKVRGRGRGPDEARWARPTPCGEWQPSCAPAVAIKRPLRLPESPSARRAGGRRAWAPGQPLPPLSCRPTWPDCRLLPSAQHCVDNVLLSFLSPGRSCSSQPANHPPRQQLRRAEGETQQAAASACCGHPARS